MLTSRPRSLRFFAMPAGSEGEGLDTSGDGGNTDALGGTVSQPESQDSENPAWKEYLDKFPDQLRPTAREAFSAWDKGVQDRFASIHKEYEPWKQFKDQGIDPQQLNSAWGVAQMLQESPVDFVKALAEQLNMTVSEAQQVVDEATANSSETEGEVDPRIAQLEQSQQQLLQFFQQQQQEQQNQQQLEQANAAIATEMQQLEAAHGKMPDFIKNQVLREALRLINETGQTVTLEQAYKSVEQFASQIRGIPTASSTAPRTMPSGGAIPVSPPKQPLGELSNADTKKYVADLLAQQLSAQE